MAKSHIPFSWQKLFRVVSRNAYELIEAHNLQYPTPAEQKRYKEKKPELAKLAPFSLAYPRRIKESEEKTILNVLKQWCRQSADKINSGETVISNIVFTNRKSARNFKRAARGSNQHFAKGVYCGCLLGEVDENTNEYKCQFTYPDGKGVGVRPWKRFHGTKQNFELCINPILIPTHLFPSGIELNLFDPYADDPDRKYQPRASLLSSKEQKMPPFPDWIETLNKEISLDTDLSDEGNSKKVASFAKLYLNGQVLEAYAKLLIESYVQKLAVAMDRSFSPIELEKGRKAALALLQKCSPDALDAFVDKCLRTISHMEQWILHDPSNFVMPPSKWFDLSYSHNIAGAYKNFLLPWELTSKAWQKSDKTKKRSISKVKDEYGQLANTLWKHLSHLHSKDQRIKYAKLDKWAYELQLLHKKSKLSFKAIQSLVHWLMKSPSKRAKFWREESGGFGIRSASGLSRNFQHIHTQMTQEQSYKKSS